jgi:hypothetical protein
MRPRANRSERSAALTSQETVPPQFGLALRKAHHLGGGGGTAAAIGRNNAPALAYGRNFTGFPAWVLWLTIHLLYKTDYRNRVLVLINWARHYLFREHAACRILPSEPRRAGHCGNKSGASICSI